MDGGRTYHSLFAYFPNIVLVIRFSCSFSIFARSTHCCSSAVCPNWPMRLYIYDLIHGRKQYEWKSKPIQFRWQNEQCRISSFLFLLLRLPLSPRCASAFLFRSIDAIKNTHIIGCIVLLGILRFLWYRSSTFRSQVCDVKIMHFIGERQQPLPLIG